MSSLRVNTIQNTSGVQMYLARAWVNFDGTGTVAIRAAGNVSSITDNGVGDYTVNFTNAMADANYSANVSSLTNIAVTVAYGQASQGCSPTASSFRFAGARDSAGGLADVNNISVVIFR